MNRPPLRILIADDHELVRRGLRTLVEQQPAWTICGEAATGRDATRQARMLQPDVITLDIALPDLNGVDAARQIREGAPGCEVLVVTMLDSESMIRDLLKAGVRGYVLKSDAARDLVAAIEAVGHHRNFFTPQIADLLVDGFLGPRGYPKRSGASMSLTPREREVLHFLAEGLTSKKTAQQLAISAKTVETHRARIMEKLGAHSVVELVRYAMRHHLIDP